MDFGDRYLRLPLPFCQYKYDFANRLKNTHLNNEKFCSFLVSNSNRFAFLRNKFFHKLCKYKKVDSVGKYTDNINYCVTNKLEWLKDYKFNICFENSSYPGYLSEKIFDAFVAGCVPIYWGDTSLACVDSIESKKDNILPSLKNKADFIESKLINANIEPLRNKEDSINIAQNSSSIYPPPLANKRQTCTYRELRKAK